MEKNNTDILKTKSTRGYLGRRVLYFRDRKFFSRRTVGSSFPSVQVYQAIPGNDQNASPTNQKTTGSKLNRTS